MMKRYVWADHKKGLDRDQKQVPKDKNDDYPTLLKYLANHEPSFRMLQDAGQVIHAGHNRRRRR
jgi:hypothetical protein